MAGRLLRSSSRVSRRSALLLAIPLLSASVAQAATLVWDGGAGTNSLSSSANWNPDGAPNVNGDTLQWNGLVAGDLSLLTGTGLGGTAGFAGLSYELTALQVGNVTIDSGSVTSNNRTNNITIAAGAGALTFGDGSGQYSILWGGGSSNHVLTNNSTSNALFRSDVVFMSGGAGAQTLTLGGAGNWIFNNNITTTNGGSMALVKTGSGTATYTVNQTYGGGTTVSEGILNVNANLGATAIDLNAASGKIAIMNTAGNVTRTGGQNTTIGSVAGGVGVLNISAGTWSGGSSTISAGTAGHGVINVTGGSVTPGQFVVAGITNAGATGIWNVTGGTVQTTGGNGATLGATAGTSGAFNISGGSFTSTGQGMFVGENGNGVLNVSSAGVLNLGGSTTSAGLDVGRGDGSSGVVNLGIAGTGGGKISTNIVRKSSGNSSAVFNFHGGTLTAATGIANPSFFSGSISTYVYGEGGTIDNNGQAITINAGLGAPTGSGLSSISLSGDTTGFVPSATPMVTISGDGTGATAVAKVDGSGNLSVIITNPGVNYTNATVTFVGTGSKAPVGTAGFASNVSSGSMNFTGSGTTTLNAATSYTGATTVNGGGTLLVNSTIAGAVNVASGRVGGSGSIPSVTIASGAANGVTPVMGPMSINTLTFNGDASLNFTVANTNAPLLVNSMNTAPGTITVNVSNTSSWVSGVYHLIDYTALTGSGFAPFTQGTIGGLSTNGRQTATLGNTGSSIILTVVGDSPFWTGALDGRWTTTTLSEPKNWKLPTFATTTDFIASDVVTFDDTATGTTTVTISDANVNPSSVLFNNANKTYIINGPFGIAGEGSVTLAGAGTVRVASPNTYTGNTTLLGGTLELANASALGTGKLVIGGGTLDNASGADLALSTNNPQDWNANINFVGTNSLDMGTGPVNLTSSRNVTVAASTLTIGGAISGGTMGLTKFGPGKLKLSGSNTYGSGTTIREGTVEIAGGQTGTTASDVQISPNATDFGTLVVSGGSLLASRVIIGGSSGNGGTPANATVVQSGGTITSQQWFTVGAGNSTGSVPVAGNYIISGGTLNVMSQFLEIANFGQATGTVTLSGDGAINMMNNTSIAMGSNNSASDGTFNQEGGRVTFFSDNNTTVGGTGILYLGRAGTLFSNQTYNLDGGTLTVGQIQGNSSSGATSVLNLNGGVLRASKATGSLILSPVQVFVKAGGAIIDDGGFAITVSRDINSDGSNGGLTKVGSGTLTVNANFNHNGATTVNAGKLVISSQGGLGSTSGITVNGGSFVTLNSGTINPTVTLNGGSVDGTGSYNIVNVSNNIAAAVANGNGAAVPLVINNLTFNGAASLAIIMSPANVPGLQIGNLTVGSSNIVVNATNSVWTTGSTYHLATYSNLASGSATKFVAGTFGGLSGHQSATIITSNPGFIDLVIGGGGTVKWTGAANPNWTTTQIAAPENWLFNSATSHFFANDVVLFDDTVAAGSNNVNIPDASVSIGGATFNNSAVNYTISSAANFGITGGGDLTKTGSGKLTLLTDNTYTGTTSNGANSTIIVGAGGTVGSMGTGSIINNGSINYQRSGATLANAFSGTGSFAYNATGNLTLAGSILQAGSISVNAGTLTMSATGSTFDGTISVNSGATFVSNSDTAFGTAAGNTVVNAGGSIFSNQARNYSENIVVNGAGVGGTSGSLHAGGSVISTFSGSISAATNTTFNSDASSTLSVLGSLTGPGTTVTLSGAGNYRFAGIVDLGASGELVLGSAGATMVTDSTAAIYSRISGLGVITSDNPNNTPGTTTLSGANTFSGGVNIIKGSILATNSAALGTGLVTIGFLGTADNGGSLLLANNITINNAFADIAGRQVNSQDIAQIRNISGNNAINANIGFTFGGQYYMITSDAGTLTFNGNLTQTNAASERFWRFTGDGNGVVQGNVAQAGLTPTDIIKRGAGTWSFNGTANTYSGPTTVEQGTLAMKSVGTTSAININAGTFRFTATNGVLGAPVTISGSTGSWNGKLDITSSAFVVQNADSGAKASAYATLLDQINSGKNGGAWNGNGITSSAIPGNPSATLAIVDNADLGRTSLGSYTLDSNSIIITRALIGDVNLDGGVDLADYDKWYKNVGTGTPFSYAAGDINLDGGIDLADYDLWYKNVGASPLPVASEAASGIAISAVPEPTSLAVLAAGSVALLGRRRRK